jgi:hypothetical protein
MSLPDWIARQLALRKVAASPIEVEFIGELARQASSLEALRTQLGEVDPALQKDDIAEELYFRAGRGSAPPPPPVVREYALLEARPKKVFVDEEARPTRQKSP